MKKKKYEKLYLKLKVLSLNFVPDEKSCIFSYRCLQLYDNIKSISPQHVPFGNAMICLLRPNVRLYIIDACPAILEKFVDLIARLSSGALQTYHEINRIYYENKKCLKRLEVTLVFKSILIK